MKNSWRHPCWIAVALLGIRRIGRYSAESRRVDQRAVVYHSRAVRISIAYRFYAHGFATNVLLIDPTRANRRATR